MELFKKHPYEEMKEALLQWLTPETETQEPSQETPAPASQASRTSTPEIVPAGKGNKYSISSKKNIDEELDKLFSDISEPDVADDDLPF
jgi:hypothetical protein